MAGILLRGGVGSRVEPIAGPLVEPDISAGRTPPPDGRLSHGRPLIRRSEDGDAPPPTRARAWPQLQRCVSPEQFRPWAQLASVCATGARSEPVRNALGESVRRTLEHRTTAGGTWQFVVKMTQR